MLDVSFDLAAVVAMLVGIVCPGHRIEVDSLNSPTAKPIPGGRKELLMNQASSRGRCDKRSESYIRSLALYFIFDPKNIDSQSIQFYFFGVG